MSTIIFVGLGELMGYFGGIQVAQKKFKKAFKNADSSSIVELMLSKIKRPAQSQPAEILFSISAMPPYKGKKGSHSNAASSVAAMSWHTQATDETPILDVRVSDMKIWSKKKQETAFLLRFCSK
nr:hypothetical protein [Tanacetum cinerariifolium]